jgi:RNA recognition motif-containing protein
MLVVLAKAARLGTDGRALLRRCSVYVSGLTWETTWQQLKDHMRDAG